MAIRFHHVDAFTSQPFAGNPAGVCILTQEASAEWMQHVAAEIGLSETAFARRRPDGDYDLRWFAPGAEVALCGHATLATAHTLWEMGELSPAEPARFHTKSGLLTATKRGDWIELDFPANPPTQMPASTGLLEALGLTATYVGRTRFDYLVEVESERAVRSAAPDFPALRKLPVRGVIITARSEADDVDFVSRFFAPSIGVNEDPVTGSSHTALAPYWTVRVGKEELVGRQLSARGGVVRCAMPGGASADRVRLSGQAVTVVCGEWVGT
ncbi:MAG: PhzF family phenazine biosynthesis protein [Candidatus Bipolaricaulis sp.]|nr:PhzF family phenazine biosynthesis protein [Candidatus Bipolaricaulis sp.]